MPGPRPCHRNVFLPHSPQCILFRGFDHFFNILNQEPAGGQRRRSAGEGPSRGCRERLSVQIRPAAGTVSETSAVAEKLVTFCRENSQSPKSFCLFLLFFFARSTFQFSLVWFHFGSPLAHAERQLIFLESKKN